MRKETLQGVSASSILMPGAVVSSRFQIQGVSAAFGAVTVYNATDQRTKRPVALWAVPPHAVRPDVVAATRVAVKAATTIAHKDLVVPFGSSADLTGTLFVATEPLGPTSAKDLIEKKRKEGHVHAPAAAYQLLAHAMNALAVAHPGLSHGALSPAMLRVDAQGHVKVAGLGIGPALIAAGRVGEEYLAPEVLRGGPATPRADVYALGAMLFELCTGKLPAPGLRASELVPGLHATFDIIIENCLAESPDDRFESVTEMKGALASLVSPTVAPPPAASDGLDVPIEFDEAIDVEAAIAAAPPRRLTIPPAHGPARAPAQPTAHPATPPPAMASATSSSPAIGARMSLLEPAPAMAPPAASMGDVDLRGLLDQATTNDAQRWMFVRGGLDHGPLSARELIQAIVRNEVLDEDVVFNMDTGERRKLREWPQYREFAEQAREKRKSDQHKREVRGAIAEESVNTKAKTAVAIALVLVVFGIGVVYYKTLGPGGADARRRAELESVIARGQLSPVAGGLQVLPEPPPPPAGSRSSGGHGGGGGGGGFTSYESAMSQPVDYNFGGNGPSGGTLSDRDISAPLNASLGRFGACAQAEIARGGAARQVQMRIAVGSNGSPMGVSVASGSGAFKSCVAGIVRGIRWRAFGGPRIGFAWGFSLQ